MDMKQMPQELLAQDLIIFDTETTGLDNKAQMVEIAAISSEETLLLDTLVRTTIPIGQGARRFTA